MHRLPYEPKPFPTPAQSDNTTQPNGTGLCAARGASSIQGKTTECSEAFASGHINLNQYCMISPSIYIQGKMPKSAMNQDLCLLYVQKLTTLHFL